MVARWLIGSVAASLSDSLDCSLLIARKDIPDQDLFPVAAVRDLSPATLGCGFEIMNAETKSTSI